MLRPDLEPGVAANTALIAALDQAEDRTAVLVAMAERALLGLAREAGFGAAAELAYRCGDQLAGCVPHG